MSACIQLHSKKDNSELYQYHVQVIQGKKVETQCSLGTRETISKASTLHPNMYVLYKTFFSFLLLQYGAQQRCRGVVSGPPKSGTNMHTHTHTHTHAHTLFFLDIDLEINKRTFNNVKLPVRRLHKQPNAPVVNT